MGATQKVDLAIIMACGMGQRLAPLTYDTPKCMMKIDGEPLVEREIKQLQEAGIKDIIIVVGYLSEKFDYLINKYNVKLVFNENAKFTNTLYTLNCVKKYIYDKNVYLCYADLYMKKNIFRCEEKSSHFKGKYFFGENDEWDCTLNEKNEILKIDKHGKDSYCMVGIGYFDKEDSKTLCQYIDLLMKEKDAAGYYWEEILYAHIDAFKNYYMEKIPEDVLYEFDDYDTYINYHKDDFVTGCYSYSLISRVFDIKEKDIELVECISKGITNRKFVFKIKNKNKKYILRVPGLCSERFINRRIEVEAIEKLKKYGVSENIIFADPNTGYKIAEYFDNPHIIDINSEEELKIAMQELKNLHSFDIVIEKNKNLFDFIDCHTKIIKKYNLKHPYSDNDLLREKIEELTIYIKNYNRKDYFCHGDANPSNMLITKDGVKFIDLEYVMMFDPLFEIAMFALNAGFDEHIALKLLAYYKEAKGDNFVLDGLDDKNMKKLVLAYFILAQYYCYLWAITSQHFNSLDYTEYLAECHDKAVKAIDTYEKEYIA